MTSKSDLAFVQIRPFDEKLELQLIPVWVTIIPAKSASTVVGFLKQVLPKDPVPLPHLRRLVRDNDSDPNSGSQTSNNQLLKLLICSVDAVPSFDEISRFLSLVPKLLPGSIPNDERLYMPEIIQAPKYPAETKELSKKWSEGTWPIMWRGNPHLLKTELPRDEIDKYKGHITTILRLTESAHESKELPIATLIYDPTQDKVLATAIDTRTSSRNPLSHSIMTCISKVASREFARRQSPSWTSESQKSYLCLGLHLITTHEPCSMCSMAMVHSRFGRLIYLKEMQKSGAIDKSSGQGYSVHSNRLLNWRFEAWKAVHQDLIHHVEDTVNA
ncbi:cytidine deaminase-like protein [Lipomyces oligophaga]|uniref:cytidine deaminase-like protein n=1 Tax=Lipomyces oligophaga TaxID=45792 RepID=UPI0034CEE3CD